jgi:hypothetical protein
MYQERCIQSSSFDDHDADDPVGTSIDRPSHRQTQRINFFQIHQRSITAGPSAKPSVMWLHSIESSHPSTPVCQNSTAISRFGKINQCLSFLVMGKSMFVLVPYYGGVLILDL